MGYRFCPSCQLNMIEEGKEYCEVCARRFQTQGDTHKHRHGTSGRVTYANLYRARPNCLTKGDVLTNDEVCAFFACAPQGGMRKSNSTNSLVLINDSESIYKDSWKDGICYYTGMGLEGDQDFYYRQNYTLYNSRYSSVKIYLFERAYSRYTYIGRVELADEPYYSRQKDACGIERRVCIFPLKIIEKL